jgi:hypothetical protein
MTQRKSSGGAAAAGGFEFQARMAAWVAVHILADKAASAPWTLSSDTTLEWLRCETEEPVDDLLIATSREGFAFSQIKRSLNLSPAENSELASVADQFVRQFLAHRGSQARSKKWQRSLEPERDRLVLIVGLNAPETIRKDLSEVLRRAQILPVHQFLDELAVNQAERKALLIFTDHIRAAWKKILGDSPSDQEIRQILALCYIQALGLDEGGTAEQEAKNLLRSVVLRDPNQADAAWNLLVSFCARLASTRSGADRVGFQGALLNASIELQVTRRFRSDIQTLRNYSSRLADRLRDLSLVRVNNDEVKIERKSTRELQRAAEMSSLLVVGEPGAGKSGALHDFFASLQERDAVFLAVDRLASGTLEELRSELNLDHDLIDVLANWPGTDSAFLIIDALDAARAELASLALRDLISRVVRSGGRWRVLASIRKFDLRYSLELRELFRGEPPSAFFDSEFQGLKHLNIPRLPQSELEQLRDGSSQLYSLIMSSPPELRELLAVPFNLRLAAELLSAGLDPADFGLVRTQLQLLDSYWQYRIIRSDGHRDAREGILRRICAGMVQQRRLRLDRATIADPGSSVGLNDLLSHHVLAEWQASPTTLPDSYVLTFAHHVLFDYAVERLLLRGDVAALTKRLAEDPELLLVVRPSLVLHFEHLWDFDSSREQFWDLVFRVASHSKIPEIGKLIGPSVAARLARDLVDLSMLCRSIETTEETRKDTALTVLRHLIGALLVPGGDRPLVGLDAGPWDELAEHVSRRFDSASAYIMRPLLFDLCQSPEALTPQQRVNVGKASRRLFLLAWQQPSRDSRLIIHGIQGVCRTFDTDPAESASLIRRCLDPQHIKEFGFEELPWLAREINGFISLDPLLVEEIYVATFENPEESLELTSLTDSRILGMASHKRQDYAMAFYALAKAYPNFLTTNPVHATRALVKVMEAYVAQQHTHGQVLEEEFDFRGKRAQLRSDLSSIWDARAGRPSHEDALKILDIFERQLEAMGQRSDSEVLQIVIGTIVERNRLACIWGRLLRLAARLPSTIGLILSPLASAAPILSFLDTSYLAGEYLKIIFTDLDVDEREAIERTILALGDEPADVERAEKVRNRLLGCLPFDTLITPEAKDLATRLQRAGELPPNIPPFTIGEVESRAYGEDEYLRERGVALEAEPNTRVRELIRLLEKFDETHRNQKPNTAEIEAIVPTLRELKEAITSTVAGEVHPKLSESAWDHLAEVCIRISEADGFSCLSEIGALAYSILMAASYQAEPEYYQEHDEHFDSAPSWGRPAPRVEAAQGLISLGRMSDCATPELLERIESLSRDSVPAVRLQIAANLSLLYKSAINLMWDILERLCRDEQSRGVLQFVIGGPIERLADPHTERIVGLVKEILDRIRTGPGAKAVREGCVGLLARLYLWRGSPVCEESVLDIITHPSQYPDEIDSIVNVLQEPLQYGLADSSMDPEHAAVRQRTWRLVELLIQSSTERLSYIQSSHSGEIFEEWSIYEKETFKALVRLIDHIGDVIYFSSGAYGHADGDDARALEASARAQFYREATTVLDKLADIGLASLAHHLLETLESFISFDPAGVFLRIAHVVRAGQQGGYQYESMAADLLVRLVERYLAEYRPILREVDGCRQALLEVLDIFVRAGWPSARRLTYHLEEIFR